MTNITFFISSICSAFQERTVGTKVLSLGKMLPLYYGDFFILLACHVEDYDWSKCPVPGQAKIVLEGDILSFLSAGVGPRSKDPNDYVCREHRGMVHAYLKRCAARPAICGAEAIVYTLDAYRRAPQVTEAELRRIDQGAAYAGIPTTHVVVAVLGHPASTPSALSPERFVENLAGGNQEALMWSADQIRDHARRVAAYNAEWCVVAD
jgi:hypothetical protein